MQNNFLIYKTEVQNLVYNCASVEMQSSSFQERKNLPILHGSVLSSPTTEQGHFSLPIRQSPLQSSRWGGGGAGGGLAQTLSDTPRGPEAFLTQSCPPFISHRPLSLIKTLEPLTASPEGPEDTTIEAGQKVRSDFSETRTLGPTQCYNADCFQVVKVPENRHLCMCVYLIPGDTRCVYTQSQFS